MAALADVLAEIDAVRADVAAALVSGRTPLPEEPDLARVSRWAVTAHRRHWGWN